MEALAMHPTVKPVALVADAMRDCTTKGDVVLDAFFLGSGTTILAAEKIGRRGYGLEIEPRYVDVAIRRWEAFTKSEAVLDGDGRTFAELKVDRQKDAHVVNLQSVPDPHATKDAIIEPSTYAGEGDDWVALCTSSGSVPNSGGER
jgi:hypothetical protein